MDELAGSRSSDAALLRSIRSGEYLQAADTLWERHEPAARLLAELLTGSADEAQDVVASAAWQVFEALGAGSGPSDSFRPHLLGVITRSVRGSAPGAPVQVPGPGEPFLDPGVLSQESQDVSLVARSYLTLPSRWMTVLWHLDLERASAAAVGPLLGLTAADTEDLADQARDGLRMVYLHLYFDGVAGPGCRPTSGELAAIVRGLPQRSGTAGVHEHLHSCGTCWTAYAELTDIGAALRGEMAPLVVGDAADAYCLAVTNLGAPQDLYDGAPPRLADAVAAGRPRSGGRTAAGASRPADASLPSAPPADGRRPRRRRRRALVAPSLVVAALVAGAVIVALRSEPAAAHHATAAAAASRRPAARAATGKTRASGVSATPAVRQKPPPPRRSVLVRTSASAVALRPAPGRHPQPQPPESPQPEPSSTPSPSATARCPTSAMSDISASCFTASSGRFSLTKATGDSDPAGVDDIQAARLGAGYYLRFPDINFGAGASQFRVRVASGAAAGVSGSIEVVLDSPTNSPLTVLGVGSTGSWSSWENLAANMTEATGQHTVYLIFSTNFGVPFVSLHYFSFPPT